MKAWHTQSRARQCRAGQHRASQGSAENHTIGLWSNHMVKGGHVLARCLEILPHWRSEYDRGGQHSTEEGRRTHFRTRQLLFDGLVQGGGQHPLPDFFELLVRDGVLLWDREINWDLCKTGNAVPQTVPVNGRGKALQRMWASRPAPWIPPRSFNGSPPLRRRLCNVSGNVVVNTVVHQKHCPLCTGVPRGGFWAPKTHSLWLCIRGPLQTHCMLKYLEKKSDVRL